MSPGAPLLNAPALVFAVNCGCTSKSLNARPLSERVKRLGRVLIGCLAECRCKPMLPPTRKHFGTFDVDLETGELRRDGLKLKLQEKPFQMLAMLLERPGEVVTREALRERLWPAGTFVDFDHGLNTATKKLRHALGDSAENPRFIETLARRGYRFIAPVDAFEHTAHTTPRAPAPAREPSIVASRTPFTRRGLAAVLGAAAVLVVAVSRRWIVMSRRLPTRRSTPASNVWPSFRSRTWARRKTTTLPTASPMRCAAS